MRDDDLVQCLCSGEYFDPEKAFQLGCDQRGGCPELRDATDMRDIDD
ncbi:hypothetical protein [Mycolicibacterium sphagni]|nr:hypothetical protein [Mycolicibacterium sphagni]MCV7175103.1 hypothetical protein [Mycolicibacterium sphagni]